VLEGEGASTELAIPITLTAVETGEFAMKKFVLAAIAVLSLGVGSAYAHQTVTNKLGQTIWGPAYSDDGGN
jgi:hypothetical protein